MAFRIRFANRYAASPRGLDMELGSGISLHILARNARASGQPFGPVRSCVFRAREAALSHRCATEEEPTRERAHRRKTMRPVHESQPFAQRRSACRSGWRRIADFIAALAVVVAVTPMALAQQVEIAYNTFLDPANANDPRAAAQTKVLAEFERLNPNIKVRVVVDPPGSNGARTLRTRADSPDVIRATNFQMPEYVATGSLLQLDDLVKRDKIDQNDWLLPVAAGMVGGHLYGLQQDYRIPILIYRKHLLTDAKVAPPRTWDDVCVTGAKLTKANVAGFAIPIGTTGGIGGAQALGEFHLSTLLSASDGKYF